MWKKSFGSWRALLGQSTLRLMSLVHQGSSFREHGSDCSRPTRLECATGLRRTEPICFTVGKSAVSRASTIQTFSWCYFYPAVIIKLVSDGLVQCLTPGLRMGSAGFSGKGDVAVVHMNTLSHYPKPEPLALDRFPWQVESKVLHHSWFMPD